MTWETRSHDEADGEAAGQDRLRVVQEAAQAADVSYEAVHVFHNHPYEAIIDVPPNKAVT